VTKGSDSSQIAEIPAQTELYHASLPPTAGDVNHWSKGHGDRCAWISSKMIKENTDCQWPFCSSPSFLFRIKVGVRSIDLGTRVLQSRHVSSKLTTSEAFFIYIARTPLSTLSTTLNTLKDICSEY
jgi:hypothetical protein